MPAPCLRPLVWTAITLFAIACKPTTDGGLSPAEALQSFDLMEGFELTPVAAEPLIADPVAMEIDENGKVYVVEMPGYPMDVNRTGRVKLLEDTNGDGVWDKSRVFADRLVLPTGVMRWKNGIIVTDAPYVLYLEDTDNDGTADRRDTLLTGFARSNPQHNLNNPVYGLDNGIYLAHEYSITTTRYAEVFGDEGSEIYFPARPDGPRLPKNASERNVRFRPDTYELETRSSSTQFGHTFDAWGRYFTTSNATHLWHEAIAARYLDRKPELWAGDPTQYVPGYGRPVEVFPLTQNPEHQLLTDVGVITSACGTTAYLGGAFPAPFSEAIFTAEPTHNLVIADHLRPSGASFTSERLPEKGAFLRSTDPWFRPVNFYVGPQGELYVIDYYRKIIEHPEWMSDEVNASGQLYHGTRQGRIYRITAKGSAFSPEKNKLASDPAAWVNSLAHASIWHRRHAQRLLVDRKDPATLPALGALAADTAKPLARLHALWALDGMGALTAPLIRAALKAPEPGLRENALLLAEKHLSEFPDLLSDLFALADDPDARVRFQLICTLGGQNDAASAAAIRRAFLSRWQDEWTQWAVLTASGGEELARQALLAQGAGAPEAAMGLAYRLGALDGLQGDGAALSQWLAEANRGNALVAGALSGFADGLAGYADSLPQAAALRLDLSRLALGNQAPLRGPAIALLGALGVGNEKQKQDLHSAALRTWSGGGAAGARADALRLLGLLAAPSDTVHFSHALSLNQPFEVQQAALMALGQMEGDMACQPVLSRWAVLTPELRDIAIGMLMDDAHRTGCLLSALESGAVAKTALAWPVRVQLMNHDEGPIRQRARALLATEAPSEAISAFAPALNLKGNRTAGLKVFEQQCAVCHQVMGKWGTPYGPDLAALRHRSPGSLMADILDPQRSIADGYELWVAKTRDGQSFSGKLASDGGDQVRLRDAAGKEITLRRADLVSLAAAEYSAMPAGLGQALSHQQMADLIAFLKEWPEMN